MSITNQIHFRNLQGDIFGGVTAAVIALPLALTFGVASGVGATAGLWSAILIGFFAALFGGTPTLISSPTAPMTVLMTAIIANLTTTNPENGLAMAFTVVMLAGIFQIIFGFLKLGRYVTLIPYTVISGFMSGIGIILIILEIAPILGQPTPEGEVMGTLGNLTTLIVNINPLETLLAALTIGVLCFYPSKFKKLLPPQLLVIVLGTLVATFLFDDSIRTVGEIAAGLPNLQTPTFTEAQLQSMLFDGLALGMLGSIDTLITSLVANTLTNTEHDSSKELIGQGIGNLFSGLFGGIPGAGETMSTVVNIQSGGRTAVSGLTRALVLLIVVLGLSPYLSVIPHAVLAGIACKVGLDIIDWDFLKRVRHISPSSAIIVYQVIVLTVFVDLIVAVVVGVLVANIITIQQLTNSQSEQVKAITDDDDARIELNREERLLLRKANDNILLLYMDGPMLFGVAKAISREHNSIDDYRVLVLDLSKVPILDVASSLALENIITEAIEKKREVLLVGVKGKAKEILEKLGLGTKISSQNIFKDRTKALIKAINYIDQSGFNSANKRVIPFRSKSKKE